MMVTFLDLHVATVLAVASTARSFFPDEQAFREALRGLFRPAFLVPVTVRERTQLASSMKLGGLLAFGLILLVLQARLAQLYPV